MKIGYKFCKLKIDFYKKKQMIKIFYMITIMVILQQDTHKLYFWLLQLSYSQVLGIFNYTKIKIIIFLLDR